MARIEAPDHRQADGRLEIGDQKRRWGRTQARLQLAIKAGTALEFLGGYLGSRENVEAALAVARHLQDYPQAPAALEYLQKAFEQMREDIVTRATELASADYVAGEYEECRACQRVVPSPCHTLGNAMENGPWDSSCMDILKRGGQNEPD